MKSHFGPNFGKNLNQICNLSGYTWSGPISKLTSYLKSVVADKSNVFGVYIFTNNKNGKQYVGSTRDMRQRMKNYFEPARLKRGSLRGSLICRAITKYGVDNFTITVYLPEIKYLGSKVTEDIYRIIIIFNEQWFLNHYTFEYNLQRSVTPGPIMPYNRNISLFIYKHFELVGSFLSLQTFKTTFGINHSQLKSYLDQNVLWRDVYTLSSKPFNIQDLELSKTLKPFKLLEHEVPRNYTGFYIIDSKTGTSEFYRSLRQFYRVWGETDAVKRVLNTNQKYKNRYFLRSRL